MQEYHGRLWHTSSYSAAEGRCVEVAEGERVLVRDTRNRGLGHVAYSADAWADFLHGVKAGPDRRADAWGRHPGGGGPRRGPDA